MGRKFSPPDERMISSYIAGCNQAGKWLNYNQTLFDTYDIEGTPHTFKKKFGAVNDLIEFIKENHSDELNFDINISPNHRKKHSKESLLEIMIKKSLLAGRKLKVNEIHSLYGGPGSANFKNHIGSQDDVWREASEISEEFKALPVKESPRINY